MNTDEKYNLGVILGRIEVAESHSPIAVFKVEGALKSFFAQTVEVQRLIKRGRPQLVGVYDKTYNPVTVKRDLVSSIG